MSESDDHVLEAIRTWVWSGFYTAGQVNEMIDDILDEDVNEPLVRGAVEPEFEKKQVAEAVWPEVTDCDRLDQVFAELNKSGIISLQNAGYTMSDGHDDVDEALSQRQREDVRGYCFYHEQDVERAMAGDGLMLAFGDLDAEDSQKAEIGKTVRAALEREGFAVEWDGDPNHRVGIPAFDWKRRAIERHGRENASWIKAILRRLMR